MSEMHSHYKLILPRTMVPLAEPGASQKVCAVSRVGVSACLIYRAVIVFSV